MKMMSLLMILLLINGIDSDHFEWRCSALDRATNRFSLPNLEAEDDSIVHQLALENEVVTSTPGLTYIYPVPSREVTCSGTVRSIEYCYSVSVLHEGNEILAYTLSLLSAVSERGFRVLDTTEVYTIPSFEKCTQRDGTSTTYCCDSKSLIEMDQFQLPAPNFAFGISIPSSAVNLLEFSPNFFHAAFIVRHYQANLPLTVGSTLTFESEDRIDDQALKLLRFRIQPDSAPEPTSTPSRMSTEETSPTARMTNEETSTPSQMTTEESNTPARMATEETSTPTRMTTEEQHYINELFTPNDGPLSTHEVSTSASEGPNYTTSSGTGEMPIEEQTPAVTNQSSSGLSTVVIPSIAVVGGSAILLSMLFTAILAIVIIKKNKSSAMQDLSVRQQSVPVNNHYVETDAHSFGLDNEMYSTVHKV